jgi:hypothetical protein
MRAIGFIVLLLSLVIVGLLYTGRLKAPVSMDKQDKAEMNEVGGKAVETITDLPDKARETVGNLENKMEQQRDAADRSFREKNGLDQQ